MSLPIHLRLLTLAALATLGQSSYADCPPFVRHGTGGDYTDPADREKLTVIEAFHFTPPVANLVHGASGSLGADIGYTLDHFPNHAKALAALVKLGRRDKTGQPYGARYTIDCYFDRALRFVPGDPAPRMVYGAYLMANGNDDQALVQLQEAARIAPDNATTHYNLGLLYVKRRDYAGARRHAWLAYGLGFPLPGLKKQLVAAGQWQEAPPVAAPAVPVPQAAASVPAAN